MAPHHGDDGWRHVVFVVAVLRVVVCGPVPKGGRKHEMSVPSWKARNGVIFG